MGLMLEVEGCSRLGVNVYIYIYIYIYIPEISPGLQRA